MKQEQKKNQKKARVVIIDDHPMVREGVGALINQQPDMTVCGEAEDKTQALQLIDKLRPDVAIVDLSLKSSHGLDLIKELKEQHPELAVLVMTMHDESLYAERSFLAGARGYINKQETTEKVVEAIRHLLAEQVYVSPQMMATLVRNVSPRHSLDQASPLAQLSDRELQVFQMLGRGYRMRQVAEELHVSIKTVETYCARIKVKLKVTSGISLLRYALHWTETGQSGEFATQNTGQTHHKPL